MRFNPQEMHYTSLRIRYNALKLRIAWSAVCLDRGIKLLNIVHQFGGLPTLGGDQGLETADGAAAGPREGGAHEPPLHRVPLHSSRFMDNDAF